MHHLIFKEADSSVENATELKSFKELYEIIYDSSTNSPHGLSKQETRVFGRVLTKLENIGKSVERSPRLKSFDLIENGGVASLEDAEFDLLMTVLMACQWQTKFARKADDMFSWLDSAPKELPKPQLVEETKEASQ